MEPSEKLRVDEFSKKFLSALSHQYPNLSEYIIDPEKNELHIEVPCPYPSELQAPLYIWTEGGREVSIAFDACHTHFTCSDEQTESQVFAEAISFLDDIFSERTVVMSWVPPEGKFKGRLAGSSFNTPAEIEKEITDTPSGFIVRVRSWKGTFLQDHKT